MAKASGTTKRVGSGSASASRTTAPASGRGNSSLATSYGSITQKQYDNLMKKVTEEVGYANNNQTKVNGWIADLGNKGYMAVQNTYYDGKVKDAVTGNNIAGNVYEVKVKGGKNIIETVYVKSKSEAIKLAQDTFKDYWKKQIKK